MVTTGRDLVTSGQTWCEPVTAPVTGSLNAVIAPIGAVPGAAFVTSGQEGQR
jgi:hypothetical protein